MTQRFINNWSGKRLAAPLAAGGATATVPAADAAQIAAALNGPADWVLLTLDDGQGGVEIVRVAAADGSTGELGLIKRGDEGTTDTDWPSDTLIEARLTAATLA
ncbi:hypothetical protein SR882_10255 [Guyparkeria halophila]|uniref:Uncharacterized protein n=1 Tax=Guyparkeria halophila TaxID=47960 RepID=A0ABZ0YY18_9GAMM|nr:hypothetical protein [Guyparkeria halophila]WQH16132.1 hypothetical protein SR882_10255 [Guyparkeria halophila]